MNKKFGSIERLLMFPVIIATLLFGANIAYSQQSAIVARMLFPPRNYEIALGDTITPVVRVINLGNVTSSAAKLHYRVSNVVTGVHIYADSIFVPTISAGDSLDLMFSQFVTNPQKLQDLGTFNACLTNADDTLNSSCSRVFGMRRTTTPFFDPSDNYSYTGSGDIPDQTLWVSVGATVVDGEDATWDPPPPRNIGNVGSSYNRDSLESPVIRLDRKDFSGNFYSGNGVGDTLTSFPINMQGKTRATLSFDYMRGGKLHYPLNWDADTMLGPESTILNSQTGQVDRVGDSLVLEFRNPSQPVFNLSPDGWDEIAAIDGGRDFEYKSFFMQIDSGFCQIQMNGITKILTNIPDYFTADFRFRFRLKAKSDVPKSTSTVDDGDQWYIDNPTLQVPLEPELGLRWVRVVNPYTKVPLSQAVFKVWLNVLDYGPSVWIAAPFLVQIVNPNGDTVYSQQVMLNSIISGPDTTFSFPDWDASNQLGFDGGQFTVLASLNEPGYQSNQYIVQTYTKFFLNVETNPDAIQEFAMDDAGLTPQTGGGNDIPKLTGVNGEGIGFNGTSGSFAMKFQLAREDTFYGARIYFGSANQGPDFIRLSLYNGDANSCVPLDTVSQPGIASTLQAQRGGDYFDQFWPYYFGTPIILEKGIYWISVSQLSTVSMELGADISRGCGVVVENDPSGITPQISAIYGPSSPGQPWYGTQWGSGPDDNNGAVNCSFAVEMPAGSGTWQTLMPGNGLWPAMAGSGDALQPQLSMPNPLIGAGTYAPMIRPMLGIAQIPVFGVEATPVSPNFSLGANYPNPFDPSTTSTTISYSLPDESPVSITICNILGNVVKTLVNSDMSGGTHTISWNGRDENGVFVPAGAYLISLESAGRRATAKIIVTE